ncbi:hypothetical protein [Aureimonas leprariae]|uniref:Uncharacterized protein n=1 Tax=Plantimonas leprariae TaxID=2615207 RepID=A0A7V7TYH8_9HYPH|nr:hypothetical protein [Aureimonas leprariae]KAB0682737.1 hypothetical protein F6X38_01240 [Aureimonas leprariae]
MLTAGIAVAASCLAGGALWRLAGREHAAALAARGRLLDAAAALFPGGRTVIGADGFPCFAAPRPGGGEIALALVADTLVTRRLPQLWLSLTLREPTPLRDFTLGVLARPTGAEFYALTHEMPDWFEPPASDAPLLVRGANLSADAAARHGAVLAALFEDPALKEAVATPRGVRAVRQVRQGDRGAHLLLRQARFGIEPVDRDTLQAALRDAEHLGATLRTRAPRLAEAA